jgi:ubiquinone/menaquinone biosynthesis C-methylase UbiE
MPRTLKKEIEYFDRFAQKHDPLAFIKQRVTEKSRIVQNLVIKPHKVILDLGCGIGLFATAFHNWAYIGVDISSKSIKVAKKHFQDYNFVVANAYYLPFKDSSIGIIFGNGIIHHVELRIFKEIIRVMKRDGTFIAFEPNQRNPIGARKVATVGETGLRKEAIEMVLQRFRVNYFIKTIHWIPDWWIGLKRKLAKPIEMIIEKIPFIKEFGGCLLIYFNIK